MVTSMLEKAIEIEGLLRIIRDGDPLPETYILLNIKTAELAEEAVCLEEKSGPAEPDTAHADFVMATPPPTARNVPEVVFNLQSPEQKEEIQSAAIEVIEDFTETDSANASEDLALIEEDDILLSFDDPGDFAISTTPVEENAAFLTKEEAQDPEPEVTEGEGEEYQEEESMDEDDPVGESKDEPEADEGTPEIGEPKEMNAPAYEKDFVSSEINEETEDGSKEIPYAEETHQEISMPFESEKIVKQPKRQIKLKSAFSLNDRFLYARELFEGNNKMFDSTLEFIEGIQDYSIIEDYFYSELEWDPENSHVAAFMDILRPHFKE